MTPSQRLWVLDCAGEASQSSHIYPKMAACEAALESDYGTSALARLGFNLFGMKSHMHSAYGTMNLPTREFLHGEWVQIIGAWVKYDNLTECFADRMETLTRLRDVYPHYQAALAAPTPEVYIQEVSATWSTDPDRGAKCLAIYNVVFPPQNTHDDVQSASAAT